MFDIRATEYNYKTRQSKCVYVANCINLTPTCDEYQHPCMVTVKNSTMSYCH